MEKSNQVKEIQMENLNEVGLNPDETVRVIVTEREDGTVTIAAKTKGPVNVTYLAGMLEVAKHDILTRQSPQEQEEIKMVDVKLEAIDFEMDAQGTLKAEGKKIGDIVTMPEPIVKLRDHAKVEFQRAKDRKKEN